LPDYEGELEDGLPMCPTFTAGASALGYLYQARYALYLLLNGSEESRLSIERFDDVAFERAGTPSELLQLKHHLSGSGALTDTSVDLWRTIRIWSSSLKSRALALPETRLAVVTTGQAPDGSIAALLRPDRERDTKTACAKLTTVANTSQNQALAEAFSSFLALNPRERGILVDCMQVLDGSPLISDTGAEIQKWLERIVRRQHLDALSERLEGWWFDRVIQHLCSSSAEAIARSEVLDKIHDIADGFKPDALPIDFLDVEPPISPDPAGDNRLFVVQLRAIAVQNQRIEKAIRDYYKAFEQRSRWVRDDLLVSHDIEVYERKLVDEWERFLLALQDELESAELDELQLQRHGRTIFNWMDQRADIRIRPQVSEAYVMRGSYHILADNNPPRVWWHPTFTERLQELLQPLTGGMP
jgi:hypothetical protein